jgi:hypothetical protein
LVLEGKSVEPEHFMGTLSRLVDGLDARSVQPFHTESDVMRGQFLADRCESFCLERRVFMMLTIVNPSHHGRLLQAAVLQRLVRKMKSLSWPGANPTFPLQNSQSRLQRARGNLKPLAPLAESGQRVSQFPSRNRRAQMFRKMFRFASREIHRSQAG